MPQMTEDARAAMVLDRARKLFKDETVLEWPTPDDQSNDKQLNAIQAGYLQRAEDQLLKEGRIESVDQS